MWTRLLRSPGPTLPSPGGRSLPTCTAVAGRVLLTPPAPLRAQRCESWRISYGSDTRLYPDPDLPEEGQRPENHIGAWAPVGSRCSERQLLKDTCGLTPPARAQAPR